MQLPKYKKKKKFKLKICREPGCGKEFWGHPIAKYCERHRDIRNRVRRRRIKTDPSEDNIIFKHTFRHVTEADFVCRLPGCKEKYRVKLFPKQDIYPKYCEKHRSQYKRESFLRAQRLAKAA